MIPDLHGTVLSVSSSPTHGFSKENQSSLRLLTGLGVEGDAHMGVTVQHRWLVKKDPTLRNLTQVHLIHAELFGELASAGFSIKAGELGENITTVGIELLKLPVGARLHVGEAIVEVTGLRDPCSQLNRLRPGLMKALIGRDAQGGVVRKAGIMGVVACGGVVRAGDPIRAELPPKPWVAMGPV